MTTDLSLLQTLQEKSPGFHTKYVYCRQVASTEFQLHATMIGYLTDHGPQHYVNLEANLNDLLPNDLKIAMSAEEIFLLLCAVQFHDIGLLSERYAGENWQDVRKEHVVRTYDYLDEFYKDWGFSKFEAYALKNICLGHGGDRLYQLPKTQVIHRTSVRIQFLAALLRLADELDLDFTRVSRYVRQLKKIPDDSLKHWIKHEDIGGVRINARSWTIQVHAMPSSPESTSIIQELVAQKVQKELDYIRPVLEENDMYFRTVDIIFTDFARDPTSDTKDPPSSISRVESPSKTAPLSGNPSAGAAVGGLDQQIKGIDAKVDALLSGQTALREDLLVLRQSLLERYEAAEQIAISAIAERLDCIQLVTTNALLNAIDDNRVSQQEMREAIDAVQQTLLELEIHGTSIPGTEAVSNAIGDPNLNILHKLKLTLPIVPLLLQYEGEVEFSTGVNLTKIWKQLTDKIQSRRKGN